MMVLIILAGKCNRIKRTIQSEIEKALAPLNTNNRVSIIGAGRTDTGVHAFGQVAHFDLDTNLKTTQLLNALNARLPNDIRIINAVEIRDEFHARFSAKKRYYRYQCYLGDNLLFKNQSWLVDKIDKAILDICKKNYRYARFSIIFKIK